MSKQQPKHHTLYYKTALITADLRDIFRFTQVGSQHPDADQCVEWLHPEHRSSMVGDVIENGVGFFRLESSGWIRVG